MKDLLRALLSWLLHQFFAMKDYPRWSLRQFYLITFSPSLFDREVEPEEWALIFKQRLLYIMRSIPWMMTSLITVSLIIGTLCHFFGVAFSWDAWEVGVGTLLAVGILGGVLVGSRFGVVSGIAFGIFSWIFMGVVSAPLGEGLSLKASMIFGALIGATLGVALGVGMAIENGSRAGAAFPISFNVPLTLVSVSQFGAAKGLTISALFCATFLLSYFRVPFYALEVAISSIVYFTVWRKPKSCVSAWRWCPVSWDEVIWLPLPFARDLLTILTLHDRCEGFRQIRFVAKERSLQRCAAVAAVAEITVGDVSSGSLDSLAKIPERMAWTANPPIELPRDLTSALVRIDRIAHHVMQYLTLKNAYRKSEALKRALEETDALQLVLLPSNESFRLGLLRASGRWRKLLEDERDKMAFGPEAAKQIPNPFVFGDAVVETNHNIFTGRHDIVRKIEAGILNTKQTPTLLLHGARRMGKTSILNQLPRLLGPNFAPVLIDCQDPAIAGSEATLLRYFTREISEGLKRRRVTINPLGASSLEREPFVVFDDWLRSTERILTGKMRVLLCLDEYERLQQTLEAGWGERLLDGLRHLIQHHPCFALMFAGTHAFHELGQAWTDRFISARSVRVSFLSRDEVIPLLTQPIPGFDVTYAPGALDALIDATNGQPFLTQAVAFEMVESLNEKGRKEATRADIEEAIALSLISGVAYFENVWSNAQQAGQAILFAAVRGEVPPDDVSAHRWLRDHDVLLKDGSFTVPIMEKWVKEKASQTNE